MSQARQYSTTTRATSSRIGARGRRFGPTIEVVQSFAAACSVRRICDDTLPALTILWHRLSALPKRSQGRFTWTLRSQWHS